MQEFDAVKNGMDKLFQLELEHILNHFYQTKRGKTANESEHDMMGY